MSHSPHSFGPHAAHLPAAPTQRRAHTRRPFLDLKQYDAAVGGDTELRQALDRQQAANERLLVDPDNADFKKAVSLCDIDVAAATKAARLLKSPNVDKILEEYAPKPVAAVEPEPVPGVNTGSTEETAAGGQGTGQGGPAGPGTGVQVTPDLAKLVEMAPKAAVKKQLEAIAKADKPDVVKLAEMRKILADAGVTVQ